MPLFTLKELMQQDAQVEYLLYPFLTKGGTMLLSAPNKSMKTYLGLNMAMALASGGGFASIPTEQGRVLYIDMEIGVAEAKKRVQPLVTHYGTASDFHIRTSDEQPFSLDKGTTGHANLTEVLTKVRPNVVFFDALKFMTTAPENDNTEMGKVMGEVRTLKLKFGFTAIIIHHMGKENEDGAPRGSRGASVIEDSPDSIGHIHTWIGTPTTPSHTKIRWKLRNHAPVEPSQWTYEPVSGIWIPTPKKVKKNDTAQHTPGEHEAPHAAATSQGLDLTDGLLSAM